MEQIHLQGDGFFSKMITGKIIKLHSKNMAKIRLDDGSVTEIPVSHIAMNNDFWDMDDKESVLNKPYNGRKVGQIIEISEDYIIR